MTIDPAFGLVVCVPLILVALAAVSFAQPKRLAVVLIAASGVLGFVIGCGGKQSEQPAGGAASVTLGPGVAATAAPHVSSFTASEQRAARHASPSGLIAIDVSDTRAAGGHADRLTLGAADTLYVIGWAFSAPDNALCDAVGLLVDGKQIDPGSYGYARPDVATFYKDAARTSVGYTISVPAARLGRGSHHAVVVCAGHNGAVTESGNGLSITVR